MRNRLILTGLLLLVFAATVVATTVQGLNWPQYAGDYQHLSAAGPDAYDADSDDFSSHLPLVLIDTGGRPVTETEKQLVTVSVIDRKDGFNHVSDKPKLTTAALILISGDDASLYPKKQYSLSFLESLGSTTPVEHKVMGMSRGTDWLLDAAYLDKSLMRNYLAYNLAGEIMPWSPSLRYCEVLIDGEYAGVYLFTETVAVSKNRVNVTRATDSLGKTGFLLQRGLFKKTDTIIATYGDYHFSTTNDLEIEYPTAENLSATVIAYIVDTIDDLEEALYAEDEDTGRAYAKSVDLSSFVDYFIFNELLMNRDAGNLSTYTYRDPKTKLMMGPVWDMALCLDNDVIAAAFDRLYLTSANWYDRIAMDRVFVETVVWRYQKLREELFSEERLLAMVDEIAAWLAPAAQRNFARWPDILGADTQQPGADGADRNTHTYQQAVDQLKQAILLRGRYLDEHLEADLRDYMNSSPHATVAGGGI